ncbi:energy transducer TonB [Pyxidicoccus trucidator]|uniref:energy transducer TonB n=1 Tax=Pyxidicoccus trucidator TaxID=2709662 RepID=UPI00196754EF|nr:energy transducer TonB [Pyxidicoccus trucidator]
MAGAPPTAKRLSPEEDPRLRDEAALKERAEFLCRHHQVDAPAMSRLPRGTRPYELIREADLFHVRDFPNVVARTPLDQPAVFAEVANHIRCKVASIEVRACTAAVTLWQTRPRWEDPAFPTAALSESESLDSRRAILRHWMEVSSAPVTKTYRWVFSRTSADTWRADFELPERARGFGDPFFGPDAPKERPAIPQFARDEMTAPQRLCSGTPRYTAEALAARVQGQMVTRCVLTREGSVKSCRVLKPLPHMEEALLKVFHSARFTPVTAHGEPIDVDYTFTTNFLLPR